MVCCVLLEKPTYLRLLCFFLFPTTTCRILESNKIHLTSLGTQIFSNASVYLAEPRETRTSESPPPVGDVIEGASFKENCGWDRLVTEKEARCFTFRPSHPPLKRDILNWKKKPAKHRDPKWIYQTNQRGDFLSKRLQYKVDTLHISTHIKFSNHIHSE